MAPARRRLVLSITLAALAAAGVAAGAPAPPGLHLDLREGWTIQSSAKVDETGEAVSRPGFATAGWHRTTVPTTVVAALVADGTYPDPHFGMNMRSLPGVAYKVGTNFSNQPMPADSPFAVPWWYRTEFTLPPGAVPSGGRVWLRLDGVNFRFDAWLNGTRIAEAAKTAGAFRLHELDVTAAAREGENALAVLVAAPRETDLAITFVDWNPMPPDKVMGLYRPVTVRATGPVALRHPQVVTTLNPPANDRAELTVRVVARNGSGEAVRGVLRGRVRLDAAPGGSPAEIALEKAVSLAPGETREIEVAPAGNPRLRVERPALWWPAQYGRPVLHDVELELLVAGADAAAAGADASALGPAGPALSDRAVARFGIREVTAERTPSGLVYSVNGRHILVRGAGWTSEMMLRYSRERYEQEVRYVKDMGLNTIRLEGKLEDDSFYDVTDREGILVMPGWCCCDHWEQWEKWDDEDLPVAVASLRDQSLRLRGRPSVFTWLNGSDGPPPAAVEKAYLDVLRDTGFPNPVVSSATEKKAELSGESGMKMRGPYEWVPPNYWYEDKTLGGPHGFATEIGPGPSPPPLESLKRFLPADRLWPVNELWSYHCGGGPFKTLDVFNKALDARYGPSRGVEEYARKAQVAAYESHRAMLESFGERKYTATGVVQWMLNNAWPGMTWHLYDFYLRPGGSYFGAKKACEPLHVQLAYDDRSVVVVNGTLEARSGLRATARVLDLASKERFARTEAVDVSADGVVKAFPVPDPEGLAPAYFVFLALEDAAGRTVSRNVYWLSTTPDVLAWDKSEWYVTPVSRYADLTALERLPPAEVKAGARFERLGGEGRARVVLENASPAIAFFVHLAVRKGEGGEEVLPVLWEDNDVTLLPGERLELAATYSLADLGDAAPAISVDGWNVVTAPTARRPGQSPTARP